MICVPISLLASLPSDITFPASVDDRLSIGDEQQAKPSLVSMFATNTHLVTKTCWWPRKCPRRDERRSAVNTASAHRRTSTCD